MTGLRHVAWLYDDPGEVAARLAPPIADDLARGAAVIACVPAPVAAALAAGLGSAADGIEFLDLGDRYDRPVAALALLWTTARQRLAAGATYLHSVGELAMTGGAGDDEWHWYEAACNEVLRDEAIVATCLYDRRRLPAATIAAAARTHPELVDGGAGHASPDFAPATVRPPTVAVPSRPPDAHLVDVTDPTVVRRMLPPLLADLPADVVDRARLVAAELLTNAVVHAGSAELDVWVLGDGAVLEVRDRGEGVMDPFAILRPPALPQRGAGLWLSHHASRSLSVAARDGGGTVATALV